MPTARFLRAPLRWLRRRLPALILSRRDARPRPPPRREVIGEEPEWITYDRWGTCLPEGTFAAAVGAEDFDRVLGVYGGPDAREQWARLMARITPLGEAIFA